VRGLFVTGTDTGVGKTVVAAGIALALKPRCGSVGVAKPVQSGALAGDPEGDAMLLKRWTRAHETAEEIAPWSFAEPLAPLIAARLAGRSLELQDVAEAVRRLAAPYEAVVVEGAGGLMVPVGEAWTVADLVAELGLPLLVVARPGLGTVNHTVLTVLAARQAGLDVAGVVLNGHGPHVDASSLTNAALIEQLAEVLVLGRTPWLHGILTPRRLARMITEHVDVEQLTRIALGVVASSA
jgi:dethiobiotin synthetase